MVHILLTMFALVYAYGNTSRAQSCCSFASSAWFSLNVSLLSTVPYTQRVYMHAWFVMDCTEMSSPSNGVSVPSTWRDRVLSYDCTNGPVNKCWNAACAYIKIYMYKRTLMRILTPTLLTRRLADKQTDSQERKTCPTPTCVSPSPTSTSTS